MFEGKHLTITGTKNGMTPKQYNSAFGVFCDLMSDGYGVMHNGDCIGADKEAFQMWHVTLCLPVIGHPPVNPKYRAFLKFDFTHPEGEYLDRDHDMVDASTHLVATPKTMYEFRRSGTWSTVRYGKKVGIPLTIVYPDGSIERIAGTGLTALMN